MKKLRKKDKETIAIVLAISIMVVVFLLSSQPYEKQSATPFLHYILPNKPYETQLSTISFQYAGTTISVQELGYYKFIEFFIRKFVHFVTFFALGFSWVYGLVGKVKDKKLAILLALLLSVGYAVFDEFHQSLTPNRTALLQDVLLDSSGALSAIVIYIVTHLKQFMKRK